MVNNVVNGMVKWLSRQLLKDRFQYLLYCITIFFEFPEILFLHRVVVIFKKAIVICILTLFHVIFLIAKTYYFKEFSKGSQ